MLWAVVFFVFICVCAENANCKTTAHESSGRLHKVECANKAASNGGTNILVHNTDCAVVLAWTRRGSDHFDVPIRIHQLTPDICVVATGIASDSNHLINVMFKKASNHFQKFQSEIPGPRLANEIAAYVHERTLNPSSRPFGLRICIASCDTIRAQIFDIDPMGNMYQSKLTCTGPFASQLSKLWPRNEDPNAMSPAQLVHKCIAVLNECLSNEDISPASAGEVTITVIGKDIAATLLDHQLVSGAIRGDIGRLEEFFTRRRSTDI